MATTKLTQMSVVFVDLTKADLARIRRCLEGVGIECSDNLARRLLDACAPLPDPDEDEGLHELFWRLAPHLRMDWPRVGCRTTDTLRQLEREWKDDDSPTGRRRTEKRMLVVTNGLDEHPDWWDYPCICDECRS